MSRATLKKPLCRVILSYLAHSTSIMSRKIPCVSHIPLLRVPKCKKVSFFDSHIYQYRFRERSGSVVECLTRDRGPWVRASPASLRCGPWARHIYPSLVLAQLRKTRPCLTERLLMGRKESNQTNKYSIYRLSHAVTNLP